jgi:acetyl-CoA hydrolase
VNWAARYASHVTTAEEAVSAIQSGQRVFLTGNCSVPQRLLEALVRRAPQLQEVEIVNVLTIGAAPHAEPEMEGH